MEGVGRLRLVYDMVEEGYAMVNGIYPFIDSMRRTGTHQLV